MKSDPQILLSVVMKSDLDRYKNCYIDYECGMWNVIQCVIIDRLLKCCPHYYQSVVDFKNL